VARQLAERRIDAMSGGIHATARRCRRQIEYASAQSKDALIPLGGCSVGVALGIAGIVERASVNQRPVKKIALGIVRIFDPSVRWRHEEF
jgi:hypothetical protein